MTLSLQSIHSKVDAQYNDCENIITIDDVLNCNSHVKSNKCGGYGLVYTDHLIHAPHKLHVMDTGWYIPITLFVLLTNYM